ncbi:efflux RND transporter periplasmic adaptor subunit [Acidipila sp. 4G-K13]|uniref:Efflux RND transporter periplasmic adaptor subunit n=2 Tax=Paracidobacterium acidisoli TaxID=2303751 RepID=A0A372ILY3_9BACT|nr:efflux RND transporter periplasmic adaptor subunit [Paracidobacterium acidisoli]
MSHSIVRSGCCFAVCLSLVACGKKFAPADGAPPQEQIIENSNNGVINVDNPKQYPLIAAEQMDAQDKLSVTGTVNPDVSREVPVISLASGRVVDIRARLDDNVKKGELLLRVQSPDVTNAYDTYLKAVNDELLANKAYVRAKDLYAHGAVSLGILEQAEDTESDAKADLNASEEQLETLGINRNHPSSIVNVYAPISGVIIAQNVTNAAAAGVTYAGSPNAFTIADLSAVWILCDVYENDLSKIQLGQTAQIGLSAYPGRVLAGRISDIGPVLDPILRTAKVRIEVSNAGGLLRLGMFVTATLESRKKQVHAVIPAAAILHLHDREWVFTPAGEKQFKRVEVNVGDTLPGEKQEILSGIEPGQKVVASALQLEATAEAQ